MVLWMEVPITVGSGSSCVLSHAAMDDSTGKLLVARFFAFEGSSGYLWLLREWLSAMDSFGDLSRSSWVASSKRFALELGRAVERSSEPTQVGLALQALALNPSRRSPHKPKAN